MGYELPETINPPTIKFCIEIPDEEFHRMAFWGAMWTLSRAYNWANDEDHTALQVAKVWEDLWWKNHSNWRERECMSGECAEEMCDKLDRIIELIEGGFKIVPLNGMTSPPDTGAGACAPDFFDHNTGDSGATLIQRQKALCITAERYVKSILIKAVVDMLAPDLILTWINAQIASVVPPSLAKVEVVYGDAFGGIAALVSAATGGEDLKTIACLMVTRLSGDNNNTFLNFKESVLLGDFDGFPLLLPLAALVRATNGLKMNYQLFNDALIQAFEEDLDDYECPCEIVPPECLTLTIVNGNPEIFPTLVITPVGDDTYHLVNNSTDATGFGVYGASIKDENGCCFDVVLPTDGHIVQPCSQTNWTDCGGETHHTEGGNVPQVCVTLFIFDNGGGGAVDTYLKILPHIGAPC